ncbi:MAG: ribonuclease III [Phycisphaerae bacterium]
MTDNLKQDAQNVLGYTFKDEKLLKEALTHASVADDRLQSNERMEFLGDAVLDLVVCDELYRQYPSYPEGDLTKVKSAVVSRSTCADVAIETGLADLLITGKGILGRQGLPKSLAAAVYESIVAAIFIDGGYEAARAYIVRTMVPQIAPINDNIHAHNYKALLQQAAQRELHGTPMYELLDEKGPDHSKCFEVCVTVEGRRFPSAWGPNKKMAEQKAALLALQEIGVLKEAEVEEAVEEMLVKEGIEV